MSLSANYSRTDFRFVAITVFLCAPASSFVFLCIDKRPVSEVEVYITLRDKSDFDGFTEAASREKVSATAARLIAPPATS